MVFVFFFFSLFSSAFEAPDDTQMIPAEVVDTVLDEFKLKKRPEVAIVRKPLAVFFHGDHKERKIVFDKDKKIFNVAEVGSKIKELRVSFDKSWLPEEKPENEENHESPKPDGGHEAAPSHHGSLLIPRVYASSSGGGHGEPPPAESGGHGAPPAKPAELKPVSAVYFINRYREESIKGESHGVPCGKVVKIQSQLDELFTPKGIKALTANGRHLDMFGGDFLVVSLEKEVLSFAFFKLRDNRYIKRLCKMSLE